MSMHTRSNWNLEVLVFAERGKLENPLKTSWSKGENRTNNKLNPHTKSQPGFKPGLHWWEASDLTSVPPVLPLHTSTFN